MTYRSKEQAAYAKLIAGALKPGAPLLAGAAAGLGKTHGYSIPLLASGLKVAVAMSTRQLIEQYLSSDALKEALSGRAAKVMALQSRRQFETSKSYREHRQEALAADVLVLTHAAALIDSFNPGYADLRSRDVILFDEADLLADAADLRSTFSLDAEALKACGAGHADPRHAAMLVKSKGTEDEDRAAASAILYALDHPAGYKLVGFEEDGSLTLKHRMPGRMLKNLVAESRRCIFTSGTLQVSGRFDHFVRALGLREIDPASRHIDPAVHGSLTVVGTATELSDEQKAERILRAERPALVLTTSHDDAKVLGALVPGATVRGRDEALADAVARCPDDGVLIAAGAWSGLDSPRLRWKTVVLPKAPYGPPVVLDGQHMTHYIDSKVVALRRINQGLHRGLRTQDARCTLFMLDPRCLRLELRDAIPARFRLALASFEEGERHEVVLTEVERHPAVRKSALAHYGAQCMAPACEVKSLHMLDVHHKVMVSTGKRRTSMDELMVLCKNHHAQEHYRLKVDGFERNG